MTVTKSLGKARNHTLYMRKICYTIIPGGSFPGRRVKKGDMMIKKILANRAAKKSVLFAAAFAITGVLMSHILAPGGEETEMLASAALMPAKYETAQTSSLPHDARDEEALPLVRSATVSGLPLADAAPSAEPEVPAVEPSAEFVYLPGIPMSYELQAYTFTRCEELSLDYALVLAIMWRESRFQVNAVNLNANGTQDNGIMQINDVNKDWLFQEHGISDLMDPRQNIGAGTAMLAHFIEKYGEHDALMAYQYGETGMQQKFEQGVTTNDLITLVQTKRGEFHSLLQNGDTETRAE